MVALRAFLQKENLIKLLILLVIYILGWRFDCMTLASTVSSVLAMFIFDDATKHVVAIISAALIFTDKAVPQSEVAVPRVMTTILAMIAAVLLGKFSAWTNPKTYDDFIIRIDRQARAMSAITSISDKVCWVFQRLLSWIGLEHYGFSEDLSQVLPPDVEHYINEVKYFYDKDVLDRFVDDIALCDRMAVLFSNIPVLQAKYSNVPPIKRHIDAHIGFIHKAFANANLANPTLQRPRNEPCSIFLKGKAGVGKTKLVYKLAAIACAEAGRFKPDMTDNEIDDILSTNVYSRQIANEYWDGYHGQEVTVVDDFGQRVDSTSNPNIEFAEFIMIGNSFSYPLHMADIAQKSKTYFKSSMYIATTNMNNINPPSLLHAPAFHRRMSFAFEVRLKPEFMDPHTQRVRTDLASGELLEDIHTFHVWNPETGGIVREGFSFAQVAEMIKNDLRIKAGKGKREMKGCVNFARSLMSVIPQGSQTSSDGEFEAPSSDSTMITPKEEQHLDHIEKRNKQRLELSASDLKFIGDVISRDTSLPSHNADTVPTVEMAPALDLVVQTRTEAIISEFARLRFDIVKCAKYYAMLPYNAALSFSAMFCYAAKVATKEMLIGAIKVMCASTTVIVLANNYWDSTKKWISEAAHWFKTFVMSGWAKLCLLAIPVVLAFIPGVRSIAADIAMKPVRYLKHRVEDVIGTRNPYPDHDPRECTDCNHTNDCNIAGWNARTALQDMFDESGHENFGDFLDEILEAYPESGKSRGGQKAPRRAPRRAIPRKDRAVRAEAWANDNSTQISDKIISNLITFRTGNFNCHAIRIFGHRFAMNAHTFAHMEFLSQKANLPITVLPAGATQGTEIRFNDLEIMKTIHEGEIDLLIGTLPTRYFQQSPDLRRHIMRREELNMLQGQTAVLIVPNGRHIQQKHGVIKGRQMTEVDDGVAVSYRTDSIMVKTNTVRGDCGGVYMVDSNMSRRIFGIHGAGTSHGGVAYAIPIYLEMFESIQPQSNVQEEVVHPLKTGGGNVTIMGTLPPVFAPARSQIVKTNVFNQIFETKSAPAALAPPLVPEGPMIKALEKQFGSVARVDEERLILARENYEAMLQETTPDNMAVLDFHTATVGVEGSDYYRGINRARSAGYPWCLQTKTKGKTKWFGTDEWIYNEHTLELESKINSDIALMEQKQIQRYIFLDTLKDETRPIEKVLAKKTRVFAAAPMDFIIVFRMYFLDFLVYMMRNRIFNESAVGIKAQSDEWTMLYNRLVKFGPRVVAGDFSNYDGTLNPAILWSVYDVIHGFYDRAGASQQEHNVRWCLWNNLVNSEHLVSNIWYQLNHSQPSGNPSTAILNSMYNSIACRYVFYLQYSRDNDFNDYVSMIAYGDDNVLNISANAPEFNQEQMALGFSTIGMTYTDELKTGILSDKTIDQVAFLKRKFSYDSKFYYAFAPLELSSILDAFNWIKNTDCESAVIQQIAENALVELSMHPEIIFKDYSKKIHQALRREYDLNIIPRSYQSYRMSIVKGNIYKQYPTLEWA